jgi:hypothetical protein
MILQNHRQVSVNIFSVEIAALEHLKRATGRISKLASKKRSYISKTLNMTSSTKKQKIAYSQKVHIYYYEPSKDIHLMTRSLLKFKIVQNFMSKR